MKVLGICDSHESSAALMIDGCIVAAAQEERFSGLKFDYGYPEQSVAFCLAHAGIGHEQLDAVVVATEYLNPMLINLKRAAVFTVADWVREQEEYWKPKLLEGKSPNLYELFGAAYGNRDTRYDYSGLLQPAQGTNVREVFQQRRRSAIARYIGVPESKIVFVNHELCHKCYALFAQHNPPETLVFVAEGAGEYSNGNLSLYRDGEIVELAHSKQHHLAHIYQYVTLLLGMKPGQHEYKVMGLAPYANEHEAEKSYKVFASMLKVEKHQVLKAEPFRDIYFYLREKLHGHRFDGIAAGVQRFAEELLCTWVREAIAEYRVPNIVFGGGVAQNIKAFLALADMPEVQHIAVPPAAGDTSNSMGACYAYMYQHCHAHAEPMEIIKPLPGMYLGPEYSASEYERAFRQSELPPGSELRRNIDAAYIAARLAEGKVIARISGRMEFGLRALGNRSILADPRHAEIVRKINSQIKYRDFWMPFTPTILSEYADTYIENPKHLLSPYMTLAFRTTPNGRAALPAAIHPADFTARPQILKRADNPAYYELIKAFEQQTGVGALLNTSFNLHGDPIVLGPAEAFRTFRESELDILVMNDQLMVSRSESATVRD